MACGNTVAPSKWRQKTVDKCSMFTCVESSVESWLATLDDLMAWCDHYVGGLRMVATQRNEKGDMYFHYTSSDHQIRLVTDAPDYTIMLRVDQDAIATLFKLTFV